MTSICIPCADGDHARCASYDPTYDCDCATECHPEPYDVQAKLAEAQAAVGHENCGFAITPGDNCDHAQPLSAVSPPSVGYWKINGGTVVRTVECDDGTQVDVDADGHIVGVEFIGHTDFLRASAAALRGLRVSS